MAQITAEAHESVRSQVLGLTLVQLKSVARYERLPVSGAKATLQDRIKVRLSGYSRNNDRERFHNLQCLIANPDQPPPTPSLGLGHPSSSSSPASRPMGAPNSHSSGHSQPVNLSFKPSPFYQIRQAVCPPQECKVRENTRDSVECKIRLPQDVIDAFSRPAPDENLRLMIYSAAEPTHTYESVDISFPSSIEIKVNGDEVKANLKGLKNRPGSTRPADITDMVHKRPNYYNILTVTYALTQKKFYIVVNLVDKIDPEKLILQLRDRVKLSKDQVIKEMISKNRDTDIQATSTIMSLKCPLSTLRIDIPCRSDLCTHNQCYDAMSFLQLQEQAPTWTCPICNKPVQFLGLRIDSYVAEILSQCSRSVDQVSIEPNGSWSPVTGDTNAGRGHQSSSDGQAYDDDLVEIQQPPRLPEIRTQSMWTPPAMSRTPPHSSREPSAASATTRSSTKRPIGAVIDLTNSSDEDEEPIRAPKRQSLNQSTPTSMRSYDALESQRSNGLRPAGISFSVQQPRNERTSPQWSNMFGS